jgi:hypothetical protein
MAAGLGFKTFTTGEVLTAADTNGYLMQGVLVFASSAARAAAITSPQEGQYSYLKDTNSTEYYDGAAWIAAPIGDITGVTAGTGISGGGTSGTVTVTNSMATAIDAKGDLIAGTAADTFDRLAVGTNGQTLVADSTASTGLKWASAASGMTLIQRSSFSGVASTTTTFDGIFTSTYKTYLIVVEQLAPVTTADDLQMQLRVSGVTSATAYYVTGLLYAANGTTATSIGVSNGTLVTLSSSNAATKPISGQLFFHHVGNASERADWAGQMISADNPDFNMILGVRDVADTYTGLLFKSASTNITGTIAIYGLAAA